MMPVVAYNVLFMMEILANAMRETAARAIDGITADAGRCRAFAHASAGLATALSPLIGYAAAADVAMESLKTGKSIVDIVRQRGWLDDRTLERVLDPRTMTGPGRPTFRRRPSSRRSSDFRRP